MKKIWTLWIVSLAITFGCIAINRVCYRVDNIIKLEFASSADCMKKYVDTISNDPHKAYDTLQMNTLWDFGFLTGYSLLTLFSFLLLLDVFQVKAGIWVYIISFVTGLLDAVENYFLLQTAWHEKEYFNSIYYWVVRVKWAFAIMNVLVIGMVLVYSLIMLLRVRKVKKKPAENYISAAK